MVRLTTRAIEYKAMEHYAGTRWLIRFDKKNLSEDVVTFMQETVRGEPSEERIRSIVEGYYNEVCREAITSGMQYDGHTVWLTAENQQNYQSAAALAKMTDGANLPYRVKLGDDDAPVYRDFDTVDGLVSFWAACAEHISRCVREAWDAKAAVDYTVYTKPIAIDIDN